MNDGGALAGVTVLVVEDEFYLADDLRRALLAQGATVAGPVGTVHHALALVDARLPDFAVLDVNVKGEMIFPLAEALRERGVPFIFATGYDAAVLPAPYADVERWEKPFAAQRLVERIIALR